MVFQGPNEEQRAGGENPPWQAGTDSEAEVGACLPWERGANPRGAVKRQSKPESSGYVYRGTGEWLRRCRLMWWAVREGVDAEHTSQDAPSLSPKQP